MGGLDPLIQRNTLVKDFWMAGSAPAAGEAWPEDKLHPAMEREGPLKPSRPGKLRVYSFSQNIKK
jgi:hypothetical protein